MAFSNKPNEVDEKDDVKQQSFQISSNWAADEEPTISKKHTSIVLKHMEQAKSMPINLKLFKFYQPLIRFRDETYTKARKKDGITANSNIFARLDVICKVVQNAFDTINPGSEYIKKVDANHAREVGQLALEFWQNGIYKNDPLPLPLIVAAWLHAIQRYIPQIRCKTLPMVSCK